MSINNRGFIQDSLLSTIQADKLRPVQIVLYNYLTKSITFDEAKLAVVSILDDDSIMNQLKDYITVPDELPSQISRIEDIHKVKKVAAWTPNEDRRLLASIYKFGLSDWQKISDFVGTGRNRNQCSQRWIRSLNPLINKNGWTPEEDSLLKKAVLLHGVKCWTKVAADMQGRTDVQCRYRYYILVREGQIRKGSKKANTKVKRVSPEQKPIKAEDYEKYYIPDIIDNSKDEFNLFHIEFDNQSLFDLFQ